jgi:hypothetical protein
MTESAKKTSQSIFTVLDTLSTETSVPGQTPKMQQHTLPRDMFPNSKEFEQEAALLEWATNAGCLHACLQKGVKAHLIDCRAKFKSCRKDDTWTPSYGQANLDAFTWETMARPNQGKKASIDAAKIEAGTAMAMAMKATNLTPDVILAALTPVYGPETAAAIMETISAD